MLAFLLLMAAFRSVTIPLVSIMLNLLSVGAGYGLITLIFQDGRLQGLLGYTSFGGIIPWIPLFMFVLLFGLSMDYHVFMLSRIRELHMRGASTKDAVTGGISSSAGVPDCSHNPATAGRTEHSPLVRTRAAAREISSPKASQSKPREAKSALVLPVASDG